jgi:hypothetical protein
VYIGKKGIKWKKKNMEIREIVRMKKGRGRPGDLTVYEISFDSK